MTLLEKKLLESSKVDDSIFRKVTYITKKYGGTITLNFVRINAIAEEDLLDFICRTFGVPSIQMEELQNIPMPVLNVLPAEFCRRFRVIPFETKGNEIKVVLSDPTDDRIIDEIRFITGREVIVHATLESVISWALLKYYGVITEPGSELQYITLPEISIDSNEEEEIPIPLVTRKRSTSEISQGEREERISEMGDWDFPFELSRTSSIEIPMPVEEKKGVEKVEEKVIVEKAKEKVERIEEKVEGAKEKVEKEEEKVEKEEEESKKKTEEVKRAFHRKTPTKLEIPSPVKSESPKTLPSTPVKLQREKRFSSGAYKIIQKDELQKPKRTPQTTPSTAKEAPKAEEKRASHEVKKTPMDAPKSTEERNQRESSVSVLPVRIIGDSSTLAETIVSEKIEIEPEKSGGEDQHPTFRVSSPSLSKVEKTIDTERVSRWASFILTLKDTDKIIDSTLSFLDSILGPTIFMRIKKGESASPYRFSSSISKNIAEKLKGMTIHPPDFDILWKGLEKSHFIFERVNVNPQIKPIIEINIDAGWETNPLVLIIPVIIGKVQAGAIVTVPTIDWKESEENAKALETIENSLAKSFENIIIERKKKAP